MNEESRNHHSDATHYTKYKGKPFGPKERKHYLIQRQCAKKGKSFETKFRKNIGLSSRDLEYLN